MGGAIFLAADFQRAVLRGCAFIHCSSARLGGAVFFNGAAIDCVRCLFTNCWSGQSGSAGCFHGRSHSDEFAWSFTQGCAMRGICGDGNPFWIGRIAGSARGPNLTFSGMNSTRNSCANWGSGVTFAKRGLFAFRFCRLAEDRGCNCLPFSGSHAGCTIDFLVLRRNRAGPSTAPWEGLFCLDQSIAVSDSVFAGNDAACPAAQRAGSAGLC
jgi:hypothetical protein